MLPLNAGLDYLLMRRWDTAGIGVSTSIVFTCTAILLYVVVGRRIGNVFDRATWRSVAFTCIAAAVGTLLLMSMRAAILKA
jgi:Na+-driven multidrug efflux pump